jgi:hypothetical protein
VRLDTDTGNAVEMTGRDRPTRGYPLQGRAGPSTHIGGWGTAARHKSNMFDA